MSSMPGPADEIAGEDVSAKSVKNVNQPAHAPSQRSCCSWVPAGVALATVTSMRLLPQETAAGAATRVPANDSNGANPMASSDQVWSSW